MSWDILLLKNQIDTTVILGDNACVIGNYDFQFPNGQEINGNVAELWTVKDGKLESLTIYFEYIDICQQHKKIIYEGYATRNLLSELEIGNAILQTDSGVSYRNSFLI